MTEPGAETGKLERVEKQITARWPLNRGEGVQFAMASSVTTTRAGYVIEFGRFLLTGLAHRSAEEVSALPSVQDMDVVARVLLPPDAARQLAEYIQIRLREDGHGRP